MRIQSRTSQEILQHLLDRGKRVNNCYEWQLGKSSKGYGSVKLDKRTYTVHRLFYQAYHNIQLGRMEFVCHHCDNPPCFEIEHLFLGTNSDNIKDAIKKGLHKVVGVGNANSRLTEEQVREIYELCKDKPQYSGYKAAMARRYHVTPTTISDIFSGKSWKHLNLIDPKDKS